MAATVSSTSQSLIPGQASTLSVPSIQGTLKLTDSDSKVASTCYRVLRAVDQRARRGKPTAPARVRPAPLAATGPHQVWEWDITSLTTTVRRVIYYLYLIMNVYRRKIVG